MVVLKPIVLTRTDGTQVELPIPSENRRWNNDHRPTLRHQKDVLKYTRREIINLHLETNEKAGLIKAIHNSQFKPKTSKGKGYFPPTGVPYDDNTIKAFLEPYFTGSAPWRAQVDKIAEAQPHGVSVRDVCNIYHGDWIFKDHDDFEDHGKLAPAGDMPDTLVAGASNTQYAIRRRSFCLSSKYAPKAI